MGAAIGFLAGVRRKMDLEQWTVGGRGFGPVRMYLLMAATRPNPNKIGGLTDSCTEPF
jgi:hypothetical protein